MKRSTLIISAIAALASLASYASAGTFTLDSGTPVFTPNEAFTNNSITAQVLPAPSADGELVRVSGQATIVPPATNTASITVSGTYSAALGDKASIAYAFATDLNSANPVHYSLDGTVDVSGVPVPFHAEDTIVNGFHQFSKIIDLGNVGPVSGTFTASLTFDFSVTPAASGTLDLTMQQLDLQLAPETATLLPAAQSLNISTRGDVQTGDDVLIAGFIITGTQPKQVAIRAIGPSLGVAGALSGVLSDPILELHNSAGDIIATNDNWKDNTPDIQTIITDNGLDMYGDPPVTISDSESIIVATLDPDPIGYTAVVRGVGDTTGVGQVEVYDLDTTTDGVLANISTRGLVETGDNVLIGGFITGPDTSGASSVVVRALGPSMAPAVADPLQDPTLSVRNANGVEIASNDNWADDPNASTISADGLAPTDASESALLFVPQPGSYTAVVSGVGDTTGVGLVEVYNLGDQSNPGQ